MFIDDEVEAKVLIFDEIMDNIGNYIDIEVEDEYYDR